MATRSALTPDSERRRNQARVREWLERDSPTACQEQWDAILAALAFRPHYQGEYCYNGVTLHEVLE